MPVPRGAGRSLAGGANGLDGAALAGIGPVAVQDQAIFLVGVTVGELLTGSAPLKATSQDTAERRKLGSSFLFRVVLLLRPAYSRKP